MNTTVLANIVVLSRNAQACGSFLSEVVGLQMVHKTVNLIELQDASNFRILIKPAPTLAHS